MTKRLLKHFLLIFFGVSGFNIILIVVINSLFTDDVALGIGLPLVALEKIFLYPYICFMYTDKLVRDKKHRVALSLLPALAVPLYDFITAPILGASMFVWCWIWSLFGAFKQEDTENTENNENAENESTESED